FLTGTADQLVDEGVALFKGDDMPSWDNMTVTETGPVYTSVSFGPNHNYTMFAKNQFLRRDEGVALTGDETLFYSTADEPLDRWEAADGATADVSDDTFSGAIGDTAPYVAAYDSEDDLSLTMTTNASIDQYQTASGPDYEMGLTGPEPVTRVDYLINNERPRSFEAAIHNEPPETSLGTETQGTFFPMNGWQHKATVRIEEDAGLALEQYPAEVDLRLGRYDVRTDCRDIIAVRDNTIVPHEIVGDCNSNGFKEPTDHTARWPLDAGEGTRINGTDDQYNGQTQGDPVWEPGRFGFGLQLDAGGHVLIDEGPVLALDRSPFTVSLWIRPTAVQEGDLFSLPQNNPTFRISQLDGDYKLEGVYRNESDHEFTVSSDTVVSDMTNSWHHVAFRHDEQADTISVFVDGTRENQTTVNGRMTQSVENIRIGDGFVGAIDEVKLYKRALTDEIIRDQQELYTTFSMAVNVTPATTQFVDIYLGSTTVFDTPTPTYVDTSPADDPTVDVATVAQQDAGWTRLQSHLDTVGTTGTVDLQRNGQCSDLRYDTSRFLLEQTLC
ncbi:MAG: LamG domain-containing protein, partial [Candidatus Nanohaloarchaeota archaeon QJJ-5]|nr:LamG domain-containing protein [Candidatus Nanohaloarchaeota archaeon QJJ-5]